MLKAEPLRGYCCELGNRSIAGASLRTCEHGGTIRRLGHCNTPALSCPGCIVDPAMQGQANHGQMADPSAHQSMLRVVGDMTVRT